MGEGINIEVHYNPFDKIKKHLQDNKKVYIATAAGLVVGAVAGVVAKSVVGYSDGINIRPIQALAYKSVQHIDVHVEALGDPGNIVQDTTTGIIYASQGQAARELGFEPWRLSRHLSGKIPHVHGHVFEKLGKAMVSQ